MRLEEYILKRKTEDSINEFDRDKRAENTRICVNYIFEYFNNYLETTAGEEKTILHDEKIEKYARMVEQYSGDIQEWLIDLYSSYGNIYIEHYRDLSKILIFCCMTRKLSSGRYRMTYIPKSLKNINFWKVIQK